MEAPCDHHHHQKSSHNILSFSIYNPLQIADINIVSSFLIFKKFNYYFAVVAQNKMSVMFLKVIDCVNRVYSRLIYSVVFICNFTCLWGSHNKLEMMMSSNTSYSHAIRDNDQVVLYLFVPRIYSFFWGDFENMKFYRNKAYKHGFVFSIFIGEVFLTGIYMSTSNYTGIIENFSLT